MPERQPIHSRRSEVLVWGLCNPGVLLVRASATRARTVDSLVQARLTINRVRAHPRHVGQF